MKVWNMVSDSGKAIQNQFVIKHGRSLYLQSYDTVIARIDNCGRSGEVFLIDGAPNFSKTTSKYLYQFLRENSLISEAYCNKKGIAELIKRGEIVSCETI